MRYFDNMRGGIVIECLIPNRETEFKYTCCRFYSWPVSFYAPSCVDEYLALDSGAYAYTSNLRAVIA